MKLLRSLPLLCAMTLSLHAQTIDLSPDQSNNFDDVTSPVKYSIVLFGTQGRATARTNPVRPDVVNRGIHTWYDLDIVEYDNDSFKGVGSIYFIGLNDDNKAVRNFYCPTNEFLVDDLPGTIKSDIVLDGPGDFSNTRITAGRYDICLNLDLLTLEATYKGPVSSLETANTATEPTPVGYFTPNGTPSGKPEPATLYIVRYSDGTSQKLIAK